MASDWAIGDHLFVANQNCGYIIVHQLTGDVFEVKLYGVWDLVILR